MQVLLHFGCGVQYIMIEETNSVYKKLTNAKTVTDLKKYTVYGIISLKLG